MLTVLESKWAQLLLRTVPTGEQHQQKWPWLMHMALPKKSACLRQLDPRTKHMYQRWVTHCYHANTVIWRCLQFQTRSKSPSAAVVSWILMLCLCISIFKLNLNLSQQEQPYVGWGEGGRCPVTCPPHVNMCLWSSSTSTLPPATLFPVLLCAAAALPRELRREWMPGVEHKVQQPQDIVRTSGSWQ